MMSETADTRLPSTLLARAPPWRAASGRCLCSTSPCRKMLGCQQHSAPSQWRRKSDRPPATRRSAPECPHVWEEHFLSAVFHPPVLPGRFLSASFLLLALVG